MNITHTTSGVSAYFRTSTWTVFYRNKQKAKFKTKKKKHNVKERERKHFYTTTTPDELSIEELMNRAKEGI